MPLFIFRSLKVVVALISLFTCTAAQTSPSTPLLGPTVPPPKSVFSLKAIQQATITFSEILENALSEGESEYGPLDNHSTSFYISIFSLHETKPIFSFPFEGPGLRGSLTSESLDENTIFRLGSLSKLLTVYTLLTTVGTQYLDDPVTKWVPELASAAVLKDQNPIRNVKWEEITIEALGSHMAGIIRDVDQKDISILGGLASEYGLPPLQASEVPKCGETLGTPLCSRKEFFQQLQSVPGFHPVVAPFHTPIYSNVAFEILAYALESMAGRTFEESFDSGIRQPLNMTRTFLQPPTSSQNAIIPGNKTSSAWSQSLGEGTAFGGMYSTAADLTKLGRSILGSKLLSPEQTRAWMKPRTHTASLELSVGMPWEIIRKELPVSDKTNGTRIIDLYTKDGSWGDYASYFVLDPDHEIGFVLLAASPSPTSASQQAISLAGLIAANWLPAFEAAAREQAELDFAGTYKSSDPSLNSSISIGLSNDRPGLTVTEWISNGTNAFETLAVLLNDVPAANQSLSIQLYPVHLADEGQVAFRAVYEDIPAIGPKSFIPQSFTPWDLVSGETYGNVGLDDFAFDVDPATGKALSIGIKALRVNLKRQV